MLRFLSSSLLLLELLREELELLLVGRVRDFVEEDEDDLLTLVRARDELEPVVLERVTRDLSVDLLTLVREERELVVVLRYFGTERLSVVLEEYERFDDVAVDRL